MFILNRKNTVKVHGVNIQSFCKLFIWKPQEYFAAVSSVIQICFSGISNSYMILLYKVAMKICAIYF